MAKISRRHIVQGVAALTATTSLKPAFGAPQTQKIVAASKITDAVKESLTPISFESQRLGGLLAERMHVNVAGRLLNVDEAAITAGFTQKDAKVDGERAWVGEHAGKFLDAACNALRYEPNAELQAKAARVASALISAQHNDGYLGTYTEDLRWTRWDVWTHKYNLIGLLSWNAFTDDARALDTCKKMGDLLFLTFGDAPGQRDIIKVGEHKGMAAASVLEPMVRLYQTTGDPKYLEFCRYIVSAYEHPGGPRILSALAEHGDVSRTANAKAYEMLSNLNGLVDLYRVTGDASLLDGAVKAWSDIARHQISPTGGASSMETFQSGQRRPTLPSSNVGEMCVTTTWLQFTHRLLKLTGEARFGHEIERTVYNQLLAAQNSENGDISYYTAMCGHKEHTHQILCCVSSGPRAISLIPELVWGTTKDALLINLYTAGQARFSLAGADATLIAATDFPRNGAVQYELTLNRNTTFTLRLRTPEWATNFTVRIGDQTYRGTPGAMLDIKRAWKRNTKIEIAMDMPLQVISGAPTYPDFVTIKRGPQILALEKATNAGLPFFDRVEPSPDLPTADLQPSTAGKWSAPVYSIDVETVAAEQKPLRRVRSTARFVPIADARDYRAWLWAPGKMPLSVPPVTALARAGTSMFFNRDVEYLTDEASNGVCNADPRNLLIAKYLGRELGKRGGPVWFASMIPNATPFSRIVFRSGPFTAQGGWFNTRPGKPWLEAAFDPVPMSNWPNWEQATWTRIATFDAFPRADDKTPPPSSGMIALDLGKEMRAYAVRIVGSPGGDYASCAELSVY